MKTLKLAVCLDAAAKDHPAELVGLAQTAAHAGADILALTVRPSYRLEAATLLAIKGELDKREKPLMLLGSSDGGFAGLLREVKPAIAVLVPDDAAQTETDHGFDLMDDKVVDEVHAKTTAAKVAGCRVLLTIDPDPDLLEVVKDAEASGAALLALGWEAAAETPIAEDILLAYQDSAAAGDDMDVALMAGLTLKNAYPVLAKCPPGDTAVCGAPAEASTPEALAGFVREAAAIVERVNALRALTEVLDADR